MDLSPGQQKAVFVLVVVVLAALGYWLILPKVTHPRAEASPSATPSQQAPSQQAASQPAPPPAGTASPAVTGSGAVDIYSLLPFTQQGLAAAAAVTVKFCADYNTYSYTENAAAYVAAMNGLITGQLAASLTTAYNTPGVATIRNGQQQVSTGTAVIDSLRSFGPSSLTFIVTGTQHLVSSKGTSNGTAQYAITVTGSGTSWQVDNIELSTVGQS